MKSIHELFTGIEADLSALPAKLDVRELQYDSRKVQKGDLFVAVKGYQSDGHSYLRAVADKGVALAVVEQLHPHIDIPQVKVNDSRAAMALLARNYYAESLDKLRLVGVTGTNGKTTTAFLVEEMLNSSAISCGLVGTIRYKVGRETLDSWNTTPEAIDLCAMLDKMAKAGNRACALEVSSHALTLKRIYGFQFEAAVFTNLSRDHLDFHPDMETYFAEKKRLFSQLKKTGKALVNVDDPYGRKLADELADRVISYGRKGGADVFANEYSVTERGIFMDLKTPVGRVTVESPLIGDFNVENILSAVAVGVQMKLTAEQISRGIGSLQAVPGRLQKVPLNSGAMAVIDYAHTPDALEKALRTLQDITRGKLVVVFGCGGDRDRGKRSEMGEIAQKYANEVIVTDDNPRTENPQQIIDDILAGTRPSPSLRVVNDRSKAIGAAIGNAGDGDVVLVAGKGHETYQVIGKTKHDFDEAAIIKEADNAKH